MMKRKSGLLCEKNKKNVSRQWSMPETAAEMVSEGHDFETSPMAGFEKVIKFGELLYAACFTL